MRDLIQCGSPAVRPNIPKGLAFEISDLILIRSWAAFHDFRMLVRLDHGVEDEEYEEVVEFRTGTSSRSRWIIWRNAEAVFVQPILGKKAKYASIVEALAGLLPAAVRCTKATPKINRISRRGHYPGWVAA
jgi:hypothetical protein